MSTYIAKCKSDHAILGSLEDVRGGWLQCPCGRAAATVAKRIEVVVNDRKCGGVCQGATGPACSCSCGGENHGVSAVFTGPRG